MKSGLPGWLVDPPKTLEQLRQTPWHQLLSALAAVFLLFSVVGFLVDLSNGGTEPYLPVVTSAAYGGLVAVLWVVVVTRFPMYCIVPMAVFQFFSGTLGNQLVFWEERIFRPRRLPAAEGLHFAVVAIMVLILLSYTCFVRYMRYAGKESFKLRNELQLAHAIQKTLVPVLDLRLPAFELYGISRPSEKVGGDLVDAVPLRDGDTVAYMADIAGHGLPAGILMGMLKTSARTALRDKTIDGDGPATLSLLMERLNVVLPEVKEAHMYATFTALRLNADGRVFYGMAASPPILHWSAAAQRVDCIEEAQFPLALLPVDTFGACELVVERGDLLLIATDGIIEVRSKKGPKPEVEFGVGSLQSLMRAHAELPLPELAGTILKTVQDFGKQLDDQTLLLVRRTA